MTIDSKRLLKYVAQQKKTILLGVLATLLMSLVELATGGFLKFLTNILSKIASSKELEFINLPIKYKIKIPFLPDDIVLFKTTLIGNDGIFKGLVLLCLIFVVLYFLQAVFNYLRRVFMNAATQKILQHFKEDIYNKILKLPYSFFIKNKTGDVVSRVTYDVVTLNEIIDLFVELARTLIYFLVFVPVMLSVSWQLSLFAILFFPISVLLIDFITRKIKRVSKSITDNVASYTAFLEERINRFKLVKSYGKEKQEGNAFKQLVEENYRHNISLIKLRFSMNPTNDFLGMVVLALIYLIASYKITYGSASLANMVMFLYLVKVAYKPVKKVAEAWGRLHVALVSTKKIFRLLDEPIEQKNSEGRKLGNIDKLAFNNVAFAFPGSCNPLFKEVSFELNKGNIVHIKGKTGVGKSTLMNLLPLFLSPTKGSIEINGIDINKLQLDSLRSKIKLIDSNDNYFDGSIIENIRYGTQELEKEKHEVFANFIGLGSVENLQQQIGKTGIALSTGQQQKLSIIRAIQSNPQVLILDEVFTSLDYADIEKIFDWCKTIPLVFVISRKKEVESFASRKFEIKNAQLCEIG